MTDREIFEKMYEIAKERWFPRLKVRPKSDSWLMRTINSLFGLVKKGEENENWFLRRFWTTICLISYTIFYPIRYVAEQVIHWWTLMHELGHCFQAKKWTPPVFSYLYLWPISQGVVLIPLCWLPVFWADGGWLALWIVGWLVVAGCHFIPQLPDPWRAHWEHQCYCMTMWTYLKNNGDIPLSFVERLAKMFWDMSYYKMEPRKNRVMDKLMRSRDLILKGELPIKAKWFTRLTDLYYEVTGREH